MSKIRINNKISSIKTLFVYLLAILMLFSFVNNAAVVADNDGSAFITKAEFDSLKNNFQSQIDQYNTSIDISVKTTKIKTNEEIIEIYYTIIDTNEKFLYVLEMSEKL